MTVYIMKFYTFLRATFHPFLKKAIPLLLNRESLRPLYSVLIIFKHKIK